MGLNIVQYSAQDKSSGCCGSELSDVGFFGGGDFQSEWNGKYYCAIVLLLYSFFLC